MKNRDIYINRRVMITTLKKVVPHLATAVDLAMRTGCRISRAVKIEWQDVSEERQYVHLVSL